MAKKVLNTLSTILLVVLFLLVVVMFLMRIMGKTPSVFGYQLYYVSSGSMEPTLNVGDAILIKKVPAKEISKGDIITFRSTNDVVRGHTITHRVVEEPEIKSGIYYYQTKGDVESATLDPLTSYNRVEGKFVTKLPVLGLMYSFFCKPYGLATFVIVIVGLFGFEMISLFTSYKTIDSIGDEYIDFENEGQSKKKKKKSKKSKSEESEEVIADSAPEEIIEEQAEEDAAEEDTAE